jgi:hypothetical protein
MKTLDIFLDSTSRATYLTQFAYALDTFTRQLVQDIEKNIPVPAGARAVTFHFDLSIGVYVSNSTFTSNQFPADGSGKCIKTSPPGLWLTAADTTLYFLARQNCNLVAEFFR